MKIPGCNGVKSMKRAITSLSFALIGVGKFVVGRQTKVMVIELSVALLLKCFPLPFLLLKGYQDATQVLTS